MRYVYPQLWRSNAFDIVIPIEFINYVVDIIP
jgi:hypothetical protein